MDYLFNVDHPSFSIKPPSGSLTPKQKINISVGYKPVDPNKQTHGKLTVTCKNTGTSWIYYLLGLAKQ